jgi:hypothetical protein
MSIGPVVIATEPTTTISPMGRVFGVLFSPKSTFEDIVRKPDWLVPTALLIVLNIIICFALNQRMNWREYVQFDIFSIWTLILLAVGFAAVNPKKLKGGKSYTIAFGVFAAYIVVRTGIAFIFS